VQGDVGGYMGLLLGASIMSVVEIVDYLVLGCILARRKAKEDKKDSNPNVYQMDENSVQNVHF
jgi:uncharacterized membrane protein